MALIIGYRSDPIFTSNKTSNSANQHAKKFHINSQANQPPLTITTARNILLDSNSEGSLHFHDEAANVLQRYSNNDVCFVGVWGSEECDKSFFYDRVLGLCDVQQDKYSNMNISERNAELFLYQRPFIKDKIRFFLLDCRGYKNPTSLTKNEKSQLDLLLSLCQVLILVQDHSNTDIVETGYNHINQSFRRLYIDRKKKSEQPGEVCWPKSLFVLYNTPSSIKRHKKSQQYQKQLCKMFKDYSFSILHNKNQCSEQQIKTYTTITNPLDQLYLKNTSIIFKQIYSKMEQKQYQNIRFTGLTYPHILTQFIYALNQHQMLFIPKSFAKAKRSIYSSIYNRYALAYLLKMKEYIGEEKPYSTDYLLEAFKDVGEEVMGEYEDGQGEIAVRPGQDSLCLEYERKLEQYIEEKEKNILTVNSKKSNKQLNNINIQGTNPAEQIKKVQSSIINKSKRNFDYNAQSIFVGKTLKSLYISQPQPQISPQPQQKIQAQPPNPYIPQLTQKSTLLSQKKGQLEKVNRMMQSQSQQFTKQILVFRKQENKLEQEIQQYKKKIEELRSQKNRLGSGLGSGFGSGGSDEAMIVNQVRGEVEELKRRIEEKERQKRRMEEERVQEMEGQAQMLKTMLTAKKEQVQKLKKSAMSAVRFDTGLGAERRVIDARQANIRRVHASRI